MKKRNLIIGILISAVFSVSSCREDFDFDTASSNLRLSKDSIFLDTVFNYSNSETFKLNIYNTQKKDVRIPKIYLQRGSDSYYKLNVDGEPGKHFEDILIRSKDSLYIFVEIATQATPNNPLYEDKIYLETEAGRQEIVLNTWIEKAEFHIPESGNTENNITNANWNNSMAHIIYGDLIIEKELNIEGGTRIYFHKDANLIISPNASLRVNGSFKNKVTFRGDRHSNRYDSLPNQWGKIHLKENSNSVINFAKIISGDTGIEVDKAKLNIKNTTIYNNQNYGIYAKSAEIEADNLVINNSALAALAIEAGGNYSFIHSTFANYFNFVGSGGYSYSLYLSNTTAKEEMNPLTKAVFANCIFYGNGTLNAISFNEDKSTPFNYLFDTNVIRNENTALLDIPNLAGFKNTIFKNPLFIDSNYKKNDLKLEKASPAIGTANSKYSQSIPLDINNIDRTQKPNIGAYQ